MTSDAISVDKIADVMISIKKRSIKIKTSWKNSVFQ